MVIILATSPSACETTPQKKPVSIDAATADNADFSNYKTYFVLDVPPGENEVAPPKPFSRVIVEQAVRDQMDVRNYHEVTDKNSADMLVAIQFSLKDETQYKTKTTYETKLTSYNGYGTGYGHGYRGYGNRGYSNSSYGNYGYGNRYSGYSYGYGYRNYYGYTSIPRSTVVAENFRQGNMLIDIIDRESNAVVWEGHASGEGETDLEKIKTRVNIVVTRLFDRYPHKIEANRDLPSSG
ncbi:MAG: DUF4136 domain-containing protein [Maricaulaceae bacterium]